MTRTSRKEMREDIRDANSAALSAGWRVAIWIVVIVIAGGVLSGAIWGARVLFSGPKGAGEQIRITNDGRNRVNAQEWFAGQYQQIKSTDRRIGIAAGDLAANPTSEFEKTNHAGLVNRCIEMVGNYNAEANKVSRGQWRDAALPFQIDSSDPATDCEASK